MEPIRLWRRDQCRVRRPVRASHRPRRRGRRAVAADQIRCRAAPAASVPRAHHPSGPASGSESAGGGLPARWRAAWSSSLRASVRSPAAPFGGRPGPVLMDLYDRAVDRHAQRSVWLTLIELRLQFAPLELGEDALQHALVNPATTAHVNRVPRTEPLGQGTPATTFLGHKQPTIQHLSCGQLAVPARSRHKRRDPRPLCIGELHIPIGPAARPFPQL